MLMEIKLYCTINPVAVFEPTGITVVATGNMEVDVIYPNNSLANAFVLNGSVDASVVALLNGQTIYGNMSYLNGKFDLYSSNIGKFDVSSFIALLNILFADGVVPVVNGYLNAGFPLPTVPGVTFINPVVGYGQDYIYVSTDISYTPPFLKYAIPKQAQGKVRVA